MSYRDVVVTCPSCRIDLLDAKLHGHPLRKCPRCRGLLVELSVVRELFQAEAKRGGHPRKMPELLEHEFGDPPRPCAVCGELMRREFFDWIQLDECAEHGIWFDHGELDRLLESARNEKPDDLV